MIKRAENEHWRKAEVFRCQQSLGIDKEWKNVFLPRLVGLGEMLWQRWPRTASRCWTLLGPWRWNEDAMEEEVVVKVHY